MIYKEGGSSVMYIFSGERLGCNGYLEYPFEKMTISSFHPSLSLPSGTR
jgi:hypothetical protein